MFSFKKHILGIILITLSLALSISLILFVKKRFSSSYYLETSQVLSSFEKLKHMKKKGAYDFILTPFGKEKNDDQKLSFSSNKSIQPKDNKDFPKNTLPLLSDYKGYVILLNFWASWCEPCIQEFPSMIKLAQHIPRLRIITLNQDEDPSEALEFIQAFPEAQGVIGFFWDQHKKIMEHYGTQAIPESYIIGPDFKVIRKVLGAENWSHPNYTKYFNSIVHK